MKNKLLLWAILSVSLLLCGCGKTQGDIPRVTKPTAEEDIQVQSERPVYNLFNGTSIEDIKAEYDDRLEESKSGSMYTYLLLEEGKKLIDSGEVKFAEPKDGEISFYELSVFVNDGTTFPYEGEDVYFYAKTVCRLDGRYYDIILTNHPDKDFNASTEGYHETKTYGDRTVDFCGYVSGSDSYITAMEQNIDGLRLFMMPSGISKHFVRGSADMQITSEDILATEEFYGSLTEDFFDFEITVFK